MQVNGQAAHAVARSTEHVLADMQRAIEERTALLVAIVRQFGRVRVTRAELAEGGDLDVRQESDGTVVLALKQTEQPLIAVPTPRIGDPKRR